MFNARSQIEVTKLRKNNLKSHISCCKKKHGFRQFIPKRDGNFTLITNFRVCSLKLFKLELFYRR